MAFGPVNAGGGLSGSKQEEIDQKIQDAKSAVEKEIQNTEAGLEKKLKAHTDADNPHGITPSGIGAAASSHTHSFANLSGSVVHVGKTAPTNKGLLWIDTTSDVGGGMKYHNGSAWVQVPTSTT